jgi:hypothetical protein
MESTSSTLEQPPSGRQKIAALAVIAVWLLIPIATKLLRQPEEACSLCVVALAQYHLAVFGYFMLGGYVLSLSQPRYDDTQLNLNRPHERPFIAYRESVQSYSLLLSLMLSFIFFIGSVRWSLLW